MADGFFPGDSGMGGLQTLLQEQMKTQLEQEPARRQAVDTRMEAASGALSQRPDPDTESAQRLFAAAQGFGRPGNFWGALAEAGNKYITLRAQQEEAARQMAIVEAMKGYEMSRNAYKDFAGGLDSAGATSQFLRAALNPIQNIGGAGVNRLTGETIVPKGYEEIHSRIYKQYFEQFSAARDPQAAQKAKQLADWYVATLAKNPSVASGRVLPEGGLSMPNRTGEPAGAPQQVSPLASQLAPDADLSRIDQTVNELRRAEKEAVSKNDYAKAVEIQKAIAAFESGRPKGSAATSVEPPLSIPYKDARDEERRKKQGEEMGKSLSKELETLNETATTSTMMLSQLKLLEKLYSDPRMPEGEIAPYLHKWGSVLQGLGIDVGSVNNQMDVARSVASNMALKLRTAGGSNLMPGAMSDYEGRLLQQMAPTLSLTREGRLALTGYMASMAQSARRISEEANKYASEREGYLDPGWHKRKERVMREELAKLSVEMNELTARFQKKGK